MRISAICAMSENRVIGKNNQLPWHLPADLARFKKITWGHPILMGRKTHESIGRPLPGRSNVIITRNKEYKASGCIIVHSIQQAFEATKESDEIFIIGGALLYQETLPFIQRLYITQIHQQIEGDAFFPELKKEEWQEVERVDYDADINEPYSYSFIVLDRALSTH